MIPLTSIGAKVSFAQETMAGVRPTTGYKHLKGFKSTSDFNVAPDMLETTTLDNLEYKTYTPGLKDLGGALEFVVGLSQEFYDGYNEIYEAAETAYAEKPSKATWVCIDIPGFDKSYYVPVKLSALGLPALEVNTVIDTTVYMTPIGEPEIAADPTYAEE